MRRSRALTIVGSVVALLMLLPLAYLLVRAAGAGEEGVRFALSGRSLLLVWQTMALAISVTALAALLGVALAWLTTRTDLPWHRFWSVALVLPLVMPTYVGAFAFVAALGQGGLLQQLLGSSPGEQRFVELYGFGGTTLVLTLFTYPYVLLTVRGAMLRLDPAFERTSRSLGAGPWKTFVRVTLPLLKPSVAAGCLLVALYTLSDFGVVSLLQYDSFTRAIYLQYQGSLDRSMAAVLGLVLVALTAIILLVEGVSRGRARYYRFARATERPSRYQLGRWTPLALLVCATTAFLGVALPLVVLVYWFGRGVAVATFRADTLWLPLLSSSYASGGAAIVALIAAAPVALLAVRYPSRLSAVVERVTYATFALPGIVVALSLVFFGANFLPLLYQSLAMLVFAYVIRFLPEAVGALRSGLVQVNPRLEEAAASLGRSRRQVFASITAPLIAPAALGGAALVFMSAAKELPVTLLLSPIGFKTLATATWTATASGLFAQAAPPALLLVLISAASLPWLLRSDSESTAEQVPQ